MKGFMWGLFFGILLISMISVISAEENVTCSNNTDCGEAVVTASCSNSTHLCTTTISPNCANPGTNESYCTNVSTVGCAKCAEDKICQNSTCVEKEDETEDNDDETEVQVCLTLTTKETCEAKKNCEWNNATGKCTKAIGTKVHKLKETLQAYLNSTECPENCVCAGSTIKCETENGREMTVVAGKSGNIIIQTKGVNATTKVILIKNASGTWGNFSGKTKRVKYMPDEIKEFVLKRLKLENASNYNMTLGEDGNYTMDIEGKYRVFWIFPKKGIVVTKINSETGEVIVLKKPWWKFRAD